MIPGDLSARLRMLVEASFFDSEPPIQGPARIREIQARLPELLPGQRFTATVERALPDGTLQAVVAGKSYTLALSHAAKAGDTLELVVTQTTPRAVFAQLAPPLAAPASQPGNTVLSATGRLISFLLTGQPAAQPAALAGGKALLNAAPAPGAGAVLAPLLRQALAQSGLFYESHQSQWLAGKLDTARLLSEPQGQQSAPRPLANAPAAGAGTAAGAAGGPAPASTAAPTPAAAAAGSSANSAAAARGAPPEQAQGAQASASTRIAATGNTQPVPMIPERLMPIVHQQLDALATQSYLWTGQVWPGQRIEWEIDDPERDGRGEGDDVAREWSTTLRLTLPHLGGVEARLQLTPAGVALRVVADEPQTAAALDAAHGRLDQALAAANVPLAGFVAECRDAAG